MFLVTGGAGFIGSNLVARLNEAGHGDVAVCDYLGAEGKWRNLQKRRLADFVVIERARNGASLPPQWAGLKFFNVFGPNEYHKGEMMSLVAKRFDEARRGH